MYIRENCVFKKFVPFCITWILVEFGIKRKTENSSSEWKNTSVFVQWRFLGWSDMLVLVEWNELPEFQRLCPWSGIEMMSDVDVTSYIDTTQFAIGARFPCMLPKLFGGWTPLSNCFSAVLAYRLILDNQQHTEYIKFHL